MDHPNGNVGPSEANICLARRISQLYVYQNRIKKRGLLKYVIVVISDISELVRHFWTQFIRVLRVLQIAPLLYDYGYPGQ